jgi:molybdopterin synthase catalytic subunit
MIMPEKILIEGPLRAELVHSLTASLGSYSDRGAHSLFLGQVRADVIDGKRVMAIEYSAYEAMVEESAVKIKALLKAGYPDVREIVIMHSTGRIEAGEISLLVLVSAGHRREALDACSSAVELIKEQFPVWKKEIFDDGSRLWKEN